MQNVAWPITIVHSEKSMSLKVKNEFSAMPVMIPGSAIGSTSRNEIASRPKKRKRCDRERGHRAEHERDRRSRAAPARTDSQSASRTSGVCQATRNQCVVKPGIGQLCTFDWLNA